MLYALNCLQILDYVDLSEHMAFPNFDAIKPYFPTLWKHNFDFGLSSNHLSTMNCRPFPGHIGHAGGRPLLPDALQRSRLDSWCRALVAHTKDPGLRRSQLVMWTGHQLGTWCTPKQYGMQGYIHYIYIHIHIHVCNIYIYTYARMYVCNVM